MDFRCRQTHHCYRAGARGQMCSPEGQGEWNGFLDSSAPESSPSPSPTHIWLPLLSNPSGTVRLGSRCSSGWEDTLLCWREELSSATQGADSVYSEDSRPKLEGAGACSLPHSRWPRTASNKKKRKGKNKGKTSFKTKGSLGASPPPCTSLCGREAGGAQQSEAGVLGPAQSS